MTRRFYDSHTHLFPADRMGGLMRWIHRAVLDFNVPIDITAAEAIADLRKAGAVRWANLLFPIGPNEAQSLHAWGRELADRYPEITPFGGVHIDDADPLAVVQEAIETYGMGGLKFHPMVQRFDPWHPRLEKVLEYLHAAELPMYVHTGYDEWYGHAYDRAGLENMLESYPRLPVVLAHVGFPDLEWGFSLADRFPQVWLDLTNVPGSFAFMDTADNLLEVLRRGLARHRDRSLMGTDYPAGMGSLDEILDQFDSIGLEASLIEHVMLTSTKAYFDKYGRPRP
ncbi:MAG: amidohydrolase family protein [Acidimicrobiia bacterium]|nr:amidohydrolase family protein [Acidimicrobiia bacterium]